MVIFSSYVKLPEGIVNHFVIDIQFMHRYANYVCRYDIQFKYRSTMHLSLAKHISIIYYIYAYVYIYVMPYIYIGIDTVSYTCSQKL